MFEPLAATQTNNFGVDVSRADPNDQRRSCVNTGPVALNVYQTVRCNLACTFCLLQHAGVESAPDVNVTLLTKVLRQYPSIRSATIAGFGEPLMSRDVWPNILYLKDKDRYVGLITNGALLPCQYSEFLPTRPHHVNISLNAADETEHAETMRSKAGDFAKALAAIDIVSELRIRTIVSFVITRANYERIPDYVHVATKYGATEVALINLLPTHGNSYTNSQYFWDNVIQDVDHHILSRMELYRQYSWAKSVSVWPQPISRQHCPSLCDSPFVSIGVDGRGFVSGCRRVEPPNWNGGRVEEGWNSLPLTDARESLLGNAPLTDKCLMCFGNWRP